MEIKNKINDFLSPEKVISQISIAKGERIADLGCGSGYFVIPLAKEVGEDGMVLGIDIRQNSLEALESNAKINFLYNIKTARADLERRGSLKEIIAGELFDKVFISNVFFANEKRENIIEEAEDILKFKGELIVIDWKRGGIPMAPDLILMVNPEEITRICETKGLKFIKDIDVGEYHWGKMFEKTGS